MKRFFSIVLACLLLVSCGSVFAEGEMHLISQKPITVTYNGESLPFPDALPQIQNGRTLVPVRAIMERSGLNVGFNTETREVSGTKDGFSVNMTIDNINASVTEGDATKEIVLDEPARIMDDRTYVPVRFIAESMGLKVNWNPYAREVVIIDTEEWRREIAENSKFLDMLLRTPNFPHLEPTASNSSSNLHLGIELANLPKESGFSSSNMSTALDITATGTEVFDGKNIGSYLLLETDLSFLKKLLANQPDIDAELLNKIAKAYRIDLDMIIDGDWNLYVKSAGILKIMRDFGAAELADKIGTKYVQIPLQKLSPNLQNMAAEQATLWDSLVASIVADDMLYTQSVAMIDKIVTSYTEICRDELLKITTNRDGSQIWSYAANREEILNMAQSIVEFTALSAGMPVDDEALNEVKKFYEGITFDFTAKMTVHNDEITKAEFLYNFDSGKISLDSTADSVRATAKEPSLRIKFKMNTGESVRNFDSGRDKKVTIPKNSIALEDLLGFSLDDYAALSQ